MSQKNLKEDEASARGTAAARQTVIELARKQGIVPVTDLGQLRGNFWPENENIDDLINAVHAWRNEPDMRRTG
jgi:hypothetical protein